MRKCIKFSCLFLFFFFQVINIQAWLLNSEVYPYQNLTGHMADTLTDLRYGFSINDGIARSSTRLPIGKVITFGKENAVLQLNSDLLLDSTVTLSFWTDSLVGNTGYISGQGNAIFLNGDLFIPDNCSLVFLSDTKIDGQGKQIVFGENSSFVVDSNITLTLKNLNIFAIDNDLNSPPLNVFTDGSLALRNISLTLGSDFLFDTGYLFIHDDVLIRGISEFIYSSTQGCRIDDYSSLKFDLDTKFTYSPYSNDNNLIKMEDKTSRLYFNGCTVQATYTAMQLTKGKLLFDKLVTVSSLPINVEVSSSTAFTEKIDLTVVKQALPYPAGTDNAYTIKFSDDGKFVVYGGRISLGVGYGRIVKVNFDGSANIVTTNIPYTGEIYGMNFSSCGDYLGVGGSWNDSGGYAKLYPFKSDGTLGSPTTITTPGPTEWITFSNDGKYIGVGCNVGAGSPACYLYDILPDYTIGNSVSIPYNDQAFVVDFSPDSSLIAVAGLWNDGSGNYAQIYNITPDGSIVSAAPIPYGSNARSLQFSPDGRFIAIGGVASTKVEVYPVTSDGCVGAAIPIPYTANVYSVAFSRDGTQLYVGGDDDLQVFPVDLNKPLVGDSVRYSYFVVEDVSFSPDESMIGVAGWWPNNYTVLYDYFPDYGGNTKSSYSFGNVGPIDYSKYMTTLIFGDKEKGSAHNLYVDILSGAKVDLYGEIGNQNVS